MVIFTAIGSAIAGAATITLFGAEILVASLIAGGLALATSIAVSYLTRPKQRKYSAVQGQVEFGGDIPASAAYGTVATMGQRVFYAKYGEGNKYNAEVFVLSNGWCDGLEPEIYFYGEKHTLTPVAGRRWIFGDGNDALEFVRIHDGYSNWSEIDNPNDALNAVMSVFDPLTSGKNWTTFDQLMGSMQDFVGGFIGGILGLIQNNISGGPNDAFSNAHEVWHVDGYGGKIVIRFYDGRPTQGVDQSLVANTAGLANEWDEVATMRGLCYVVVEREWDEELFQRGRPDFKFVLRGLREYDPRYDSTVVGGSGVQRLDDPSTWVHTNNPAVHRLNYQLGLRGLISNRTIIGEGKSLGQLELGSYFTAMNVCDTPRNGKPTYSCSLIVSGEDDHTEVLREFDDAMAGYGMNRRGLSGIIAGAPQIPVLTITDDDLRPEESVELKRRKSAFDLYNHFSGQFTSPESHWEPESLWPVYSNADVAADGRARQISNDFLQVTDADIAQYLLTIRYRQNRKGGSVTLPVSRRVGFAVTEGEWVTYAGITWLITGWTCDSEYRVSLTLAETGSDVYADEGIESGPIVVPPPILINPSMLMTVNNFRVDIGLLTNQDGEDYPALVFKWDPPNDPTITEVRFEYKIDDGSGGLSNATLITDVSTDPESGEYVATKGVVGNKRHVARATITTVPDRLKTWTPWVSTIDPTARASVRAYLEAFGADAYALIQGAYERMDELKTEIEQLAIAASDALGEQIEQRSVAVRYRDATAVALSTMSASIEDHDGQIEANAEILDYVQAKIGDHEADALWRMVTTVESGGDVVSRIDFQTRATVSDSMASSGLMLRSGFTNGNPAAPFSDVVVSADRFIVIHDGDEVSPFTISGGDVYINSALIEELDANKITAGTLTLSKWAPPTAGDNVILRLGAADRPYDTFTTDWPTYVMDVDALETVSSREGWVFADVVVSSISFRLFVAVGFEVVISGTVRVKFDHRRVGSGGWSNVRILQNGTEIERVWTDSTSWQSRSFDIAVSADDNITIQHMIDAGAGDPTQLSQIRNIVVCSGNVTPAVH